MRHGDVDIRFSRRNTGRRYSADNATTALLNRRAQPATALQYAEPPDQKGHMSKASYRADRFRRLTREFHVLQPASQCVWAFDGYPNGGERSPVANRSSLSVQPSDGLVFEQAGVCDV